MEPDLGALYAAARTRITAMVADVDADTPVPATPGWTVHDVVAHLRGVVEDALSGNLDGAATDPWTAAQVERARDKTVAQLVVEWNEQAPMIEGFLSSPAGQEVSAAVLDVQAHEADLCGALGRPQALSAEGAAFMFGVLAGSVTSRAAEHGLPALRVVSPDGLTAGEPDAVAELRIDCHELHRAALGRRSPDQVAGYDWSVADPRPYVSVFAVFGPRTDALVD